MKQLSKGVSRKQTFSQNKFAAFYTEHKKKT